MTLRISVGGGKGGVGKSLVALNLASSLARLGMHTVLVDGDLGAPTLHSLLGVDRVGPTLQALFDRRIQRIEEALVTTRVPGLSLVAGTSLPGAANIPHQVKLKFLRQLRSMEADAVVIDVGAGMSFHTLDLFGAADARLIVATPELTSLQNAYCFAKAALARELAAIARSAGAEQAWAASFDGRELGRASVWLDRFDELRPDVAPRVRAHVASFGVGWVGNRTSGEDGKHAIFALARLAREVLSVRAPVLTTIPTSRALERSVGERAPAVCAPGADRGLSRAFEELVEGVLAFELRTSLPEIANEPPRDASENESPHGFARRLGPHRRRSERVDVSLQAEVRVASGRHPAEVVDVSNEGVRLMSRAEAQLGEPVAIAVRSPHGTCNLVGVVRHVQPGSMGIALDAPSAALTPQLLGTPAERVG